MPRMANDSDVAQARILLSALNDHIARISGLLEKAERRSPAKYGPQEWPAGMRIIARRERPHPGAQLRLTDHNGWRITCFATNTRGIGWTLATLEVRHRQRARAEDRIRCLKDTGLRNLPFHSYHANRVWLEVVAMAADLITWTQTLAFDEHHPARKWEPNASAFAYSPWLGASSAPAAGDDSGYPETGTGTTSLTPAGPACALPEKQPAHPTHRGPENRRSQRRRPPLPRQRRRTTPPPTEPTNRIMKLRG